jgi:hypothetical protein
MRSVSRALGRWLKTVTGASIGAALLFARPLLGSPQMPPKTGDDEEILWHYRGSSPLKVLILGTGLPVLVYIVLMLLYLTWVPGDRIRPPLYVWGPAVLVALLPVRRVWIVEVALTDRGIRRYTGTLVRFVPTWTYVPYEEIVTATQTSGRDSPVAYHQTGVRVVTDRGEDHFYRTGSDTEDFLQILADLTTERVVEEPTSESDADAAPSADKREEESASDQPYGFISEDTLDDEEHRE